jgi:hypothetical protein
LKLDPSLAGALSGASDLTTQTTQKKKLQIKKIQNIMKNEQQYETTKPNKKNLHLYQFQLL